MEITLVKLLQSIASKPEAIQVVREDPETGTVLFNITADEEDKALIIGKNGRTIKALNSIISVKGLKENKRVLLKIL